ncbi:WecB/TagA/CpsF family glycosyltransferase [Leptobacterium flavescens]|uniref:WecB/TagA/CpsF family glycosyltransferase n=1 Tax=Leptobacterium flavescens TaxID=472055 RepID=A0A6P0UQV1_9FLAO|nr:WecB/TagA/CpsF family glycosyltransferase [Leptobacterium flavescens]NER13243.1 WecB/TagA/CpsF family glycosyltransferase [Leptobacterium flavescens]
MKTPPFTYINKKRTYAFKSKEDFLNAIENEKKILVALNAEKLNKSNIELDQIINDNIGYPDGVGAVWALSRKGLDSVKIAGAEFWLDIIERYQQTKTFYFVGGSQEVIENTILKLKQNFHDIHIKGFRNGFLGKGDKEILINEIKKCNPDVIFVAQGTPKQEFLMNELNKEHQALYMGLGGSFDVYTGLKKRAPKLFIKLGLEWFYRLLIEPTRWRRQLTYFNFAVKVITNRI